MIPLRRRHINEVIAQELYFRLTDAHISEDDVFFPKGNNEEDNRKIRADTTVSRSSAHTILHL
jgi:hypothetical protein